MCSGKTHFIQNKLYFDNYYDYQALIPVPIESLVGVGGKFDAGYKIFFVVVNRYKGKCKIS